MKDKVGKKKTAKEESSTTIDPSPISKDEKIITLANLIVDRLMEVESLLGKELNP